MKIGIEQYQIEGPNKRIVLLSDLHYFGKKEKRTLIRIYHQLEKMEYDYLCISGDLLDKSDVEDEEWLLEYIKNLGELSKVMIGIGNHELINDKKKKEYTFRTDFYEKMNKIPNVVVLNNATYTEGKIRFIGITLPVSYYYEYHENATYFIKYVNHQFSKPYKDSKYNILLCHTPIPFAKEETYRKTKLLEGVNLVLCGHMHGGMLPKIFRKYGHGHGLVGPFKTFFPNYSYGIFKSRKPIVIVSTGVTKISQAHFLSCANFLFQSEITVIDLKK